MIASRALMGVGAAFIMPATLSIITSIFPPHERAQGHRHLGRASPVPAPRSGRS